MPLATFGFLCVSLELTDQLLELTALLRTHNVVAATDVLAGDKDVGHRALTRLLSQVVLYTS